MTDQSDQAARPDGEMDYSGYSLEELYAAKSYIDKASYPENYKNLTAAIDRAKSRGSVSVSVDRPRGAHDDGGYSPLKRLLIPRYDEAALFSMCCAVGLLIAFDTTFRTDSFDLFFKRLDIRDLIFLLLMVGGMSLSLFHAFSRRRKTELEKELMLLFAVMLNGMSALFAGIHAIENPTGILLIAPVANFANAIWLFTIYRMGEMNLRSIGDGDASPLQLVASALVVGLAFWVCSSILDLYWAITLSVCVAYSSNLDSLLRPWVQRLAPQDVTPGA